MHSTKRIWTVGMCASILAFSPTASAKEKSYPEHGTIVSTKTSEEVEAQPVRTDNNGKVRGGGSTTYYLTITTRGTLRRR